MIRFCLGFCYDGIIPIANTIISLLTPSQNRGKVFGVANNITFMGNILGPLIGSLVMTAFHGISYVFFLTGIILFFAGAALPLVLKNTEMLFLQQDKEPQKTSHRESFSIHYK